MKYSEIPHTKQIICILRQTYLQHLTSAQGLLSYLCPWTLLLSHILAIFTVKLF